MTYHCEPVVKIICDSINPKEERLITLQCKFWRPLLPELNTHRVFSRNSRSSRATPTSELIKQVREEPWGPKSFGINQAGMVAGGNYSGVNKEILIKVWKQLADTNSSLVNSLSMFNLHKQVINRILEPYTYAMTLVTADNWDNFFKLRLALDAQPEMQDLAKAMKAAIDSSTPKKLNWGDWHLPYISEEELSKYPIDDLVKVSAARCARVSYKAFDGSIDIEKDKVLAEKLISNKHLSPLEMVAQATEHIELKDKSNFSGGWLQYRKVIEASTN